MNNTTTAKYNKFRRVAAFVFGVAVLLTSLYFSKEGFAFKVDNTDVVWVGWILGGAVSVAQFMFNTERDEIDWTIALVGLVAYTYSIWSNIQGWESLRGTADWMNWAGGAFMDIFPEKAIAWSLGAVKAGDFVGNILGIIQNPDRLNEEVNASTGGRRIQNRQDHIRQLEQTRRVQPATNSNRVQPATNSGRFEAPKKQFPSKKPATDLPPFLQEIKRDADRTNFGNDPRTWGGDG